MNRNDATPANPPSRPGMRPVRFRAVLHGLLRQAQDARRRTQFLRDACEQILRFTGVDELSVRIDESGKTLRCRAATADRDEVEVTIRGGEGGTSDGSAHELADPIPDEVVESILAGHVRSPTASFTRERSFWTGDATHPIMLGEPGGGQTAIIGGELLSLALIPIPLGSDRRGLLFLGCRRRDAFSRAEIQTFEAVAETLGVALAHQRAQWALGERVKEMTCLYGIGKVAQESGISIDELLGRVASLLPPGWQYPENTCARVSLDGSAHCSEGFEETAACQMAIITVDGMPRGKVEVFYTRQMPELDEGPLLAEERKLIDAVAGQLALIIEHKLAGEERE